MPVVLFLYYIAPWRLKNPLLLMASLLFYAWGEVFYTGVMIASILINYILGLVIHRATDCGKLARKYLVLAIVSNLGLLGFFKYSAFVVRNVNHLCDFIGIQPFSVPDIHLPIGISFFTFQAMSYIIDLYRGQVSVQKNPLKLGLYISLFPQLIAGPIVRYADIEIQLDKRTHRLQLFESGVLRFLIGLCKKVLIANTVAAPVDKLFALSPDELNATLCWMAVAGYTLQIYFDFSGYSDMAIGLGRMFGFEFRENFQWPYGSTSIREFWRRWHISLSSWFRDYLYLPLGGNRRGPWITYRNLLIVFLLCGLWHGASWTFVVWGLYHGIFLMLERARWGYWLDRMPRPLRHVYVMLTVMIGWLFFRADSMNQAVSWLMIMMGLQTGQGVVMDLTYYFDAWFWIIFAAGVVGSTPIISALARRWAALEATEEGTFRGVMLALIPRMSLMLISLMAYMTLLGQGYNPFIYFRF